MSDQSETKFSNNPEIDSNSIIQIYLFNREGKYYWSNGENLEASENRGILHSGLFATLYTFSLETLGEKLHDLMINELRINIFSLLDSYLVAIVTPKFLKIDKQRIKGIEGKIKKKLQDDKKKSVDVIIKHLNSLLQELLRWLEKYDSQSKYAISLLTEQIHMIEEFQTAVYLYTWDWNRVFKYVPSGIDLDYQIEEIIDTTVKTLDNLPQLNNAHIIVRNTIIYFSINEMVLILAKPLNDTDDAPIDKTIADTINAGNFLDTVVDEIVSRLE